MWLPLSHSLVGTWPATRACVLTGNQTHDPLVCRPVLNPLSHTSKGVLYCIFKKELATLKAYSHDWESQGDFCLSPARGQPQRPRS